MENETCETTDEKCELASNMELRGDKKGRHVEEVEEQMRHSQWSWPSECLWLDAQLAEKVECSRDFLKYRPPNLRAGYLVKREIPRLLLMPELRYCIEELLKTFLAEWCAVFLSEQLWTSASRGKAGEA